MDYAAKDVITLAVAVVGAVLGVANFARSLTRDRVRLRVIPLCRTAMDGRVFLRVEVANLGFFPISVTEVTLAGRGLDPIRIHDTAPERLESRAGSAFDLAPWTQEKLFTEFTGTNHAALRVTVVTACGVRVERGGQGFREWITKARQQRAQTAQHSHQEEE